MQRYLALALLSAAVLQPGLAAERTLTIHDYTGRGFPPDLVEYNLTGKERTWRKLRVFGADGKQVPSQVRTGAAEGVGVLQFVTDLPADGEVAYTVRTARGKAAAGSVTAEKQDGNLILRSGLLAVRVPDEIDKSFATPVAATSLPAPILAFQNQTGKWLGKSSILSQRKVKAFSVKLVEGSVCTELSYEILWAEGGFYRARLRVIDRVPLVKVREEYDMQKLDGTQFWELDLGHGWQPDRAQTASHHGSGNGDANGRVVDLAGLMKKEAAQYLVGDQGWGKLSHLGLFVDAEVKKTPKTFPLVGIVPLRKGLWRKSNAMEVRSKGAHDMRLRLPMGARHADWRRDITSETSPFSTAEHEMGLSKTYGRRVWGLALGHPSIPGAKSDRAAYQLQRLYGIVGLNRYKDFILEWPDARPAYPRLYGGKRRAPEATVAKCLAALRTSCRYYFSTPHSSHHTTSGNYLMATQADALLGDAAMPVAARREIRARLALHTYLYEDADMVSYGNGHHHGNPNMGTSRFWSGPCFLALIPDHPMYAKWLAHMDEYGAYNISSQVAPGGGYFEFGAAYHMHGFGRATNGFPALAKAGGKRAKAIYQNHVAPDWAYYMNLLTPYDSRWKSRVIPGLANSPPGNTEHFIEAAGALLEHDRQLAANLLWAWQANGAWRRANMALAPGDLKPVEPKLTSRVYPGIGVVFRAHQGPDETYMFFRGGFQWSHWTPADPGLILLASRGAVLFAFQPYQYGNSSDKSFDPNNIIRFGHPENSWPHGWGDSNVIDHAFGPTIDYAWASTGFPDWFIHPGISPTWRKSFGVTEANRRKLDNTHKQTQGAFEWNRQIMFMKGKTAKSPNYFVVRDTMPGDGKLTSYLGLDLLGTKADLAFSGNTVQVNTEWPVKMDLTFAGRRTLKADTIEQLFRFAPHNANLGSRVRNGAKASPNWVKRDGTPFTGTPDHTMSERHTLTRITTAPGKGYYWVIYPRAANEPKPTIKLLQPDVLKITHPEGTDYVCLTPTPVAVKAEAATFDSAAAAVRVAKQTVTLMTASAGVVGYEKCVVEAGSHLEKTFPVGALPQKPRTIAGPKTAMALPAVQPEEKPLAPGVHVLMQEGVAKRYRLEPDKYLVYSSEGVHLEGRAAVIEITEGGIRFIVAANSYAKLAVGNVGIRGVGPFNLTFTDNGVRGSIEGPTRSFACTWPDGITRPMFRLDGVRYFAGWADDHSIGKGTDKPQFSVGFGVTAGKHQIEISEWTYPALPPEPPRKSIGL